MKSLLISSSFFFLGVAPVVAVNISSAGVDGDDRGLLKVNQADPYWWFCVQPDGSAGPLAAGPAGYAGEVVTLDEGWSRQTTERFAFAESTTQERKDDLVTQVTVITYILDTYLPWSETSDRFLEQVADPVSSTDQAANVNFFNRFYAAHEYIKALHGKLYDATFSDLSVYDPVNPFPSDTAANAARLAFFDQIGTDIRNKDLADFFTSYEPEHPYAIISTFQPQGTALDFQDALILGTVPEPTTGLLALVGIFLTGRRHRA